MDNKCIRCGFNDHPEGAVYCQNCGLELNGNYCPNESCDLNNGESVPCPVDACYCPYCGSETTFFKEGLVKPYLTEDD